MHDFYIAGPLFTEAELAYNLRLYYGLKSAGFKIFLPQLVQEELPNMIFHSNLRNLLQSKRLIAICDGADMDSGTAWEVGHFYGRGDIFALRTDFRKSADDPSGINLMISNCATINFYNTKHMIGWITKFVRRI